MAEDDEIDFDKARREMNEAANALRRIAGKPEIPFVPSGPGQPPYCSFCGKGRSEVKRMMRGPTEVYICNECVVVCSEIIEGEESNE